MNAHVVVEDGGYRGEIAQYSDELWGVQIQLSRTLRAGEQLVLVYDTIFSYQSQVDPVFKRITRTHDIDSVSVRVRFDESNLPVRIHRVHWDLEDIVLDEEPVELDAQNTAIASADPLPAGSGVGFRWEW